MNSNNDYIIESNWGFWDSIKKRFECPELADVFPTLEKASAELENIEKGFNAFVRQLEDDEQEMFLDEIPNYNPGKDVILKLNDKSNLTDKSNFSLN